MSEELGEPHPEGFYVAPNCCQMAREHIWWKPRTLYNRRGWFLHGWLYLVLCIWCGKKFPEEP